MLSPYGFWKNVHALIMCVDSAGIMGSYNGTDEGGVPFLGLCFNIKKLSPHTFPLDYIDRVFIVGAKGYVGDNGDFIEGGVR